MLEQEKSTARDAAVSRSWAWILCVSYSLSWHFLVLTRASHFGFLNVRPQALLVVQPSPMLAARRSVQGSIFGVKDLNTHTRLWWSLLIVLPCGTYFVPLASDSLTAFQLVIIIASHSAVLCLGENLVFAFHCCLPLLPCRPNLLRCVLDLFR